MTRYRSIGGRFLGIAGVLFALFVLAGCTAANQLRGLAGEGAAKAVEAECALSIEQRTLNLNATNDALMGAGKRYRATALDCDGDGSPDFTMDRPIGGDMLAYRPIVGNGGSSGSPEQWGKPII